MKYIAEFQCVITRYHVCNYSKWSVSCKNKSKVMLFEIAGDFSYKYQPNNKTTIRNTKSHPTEQQSAWFRTKTPTRSNLNSVTIFRWKYLQC